MSATGVFARSSRTQLPSTPSIRGDTPIPFPPRQTRKRGVLMTQEDTESEPDRKRRITNTDTYDMIVSVIKDQQAGRRNNIELAIQLLENEYQERLSTTDFIDALEVLENNSKAFVFITLKSSLIRDNWLCKNAGVQILNKASNIEFI